MLRVRDAVLIYGTGSPSRPETRHLFFVLTPRDSAAKQMLVPVGTPKKNPDNSCIIRAGEHEFVVCDSIVLYGRCKLFDIGRLEADLRRGSVSQLSPASDALFSRIVAGLRSSPFSPGWARKKFGNPS